jgi:hypothetical protein
MSDNTNITKTNQTSSVTQTGQTQNMPRQALAPAVDIAESESGITLLADMPGVSKERLTIKVEGDSLTIEGQAQIDVPDNIELLHSEVRSPLSPALVHTQPRPRSGKDRGHAAQRRAADAHPEVRRGSAEADRGEGGLSQKRPCLPRRSHAGASLYRSGVA